MTDLEVQKMMIENEMDHQKKTFTEFQTYYKPTKLGGLGIAIQWSEQAVMSEYIYTQLNYLLEGLNQEKVDDMINNQKRLLIGMSDSFNSTSALSNAASHAQHKGASRLIDILESVSHKGKGKLS